MIEDRDSAARILGGEETGAAAAAIESTASTNSASTRFVVRPGMCLLLLSADTVSSDR